MYLGCYLCLIRHNGLQTIYVCIYLAFELVILSHLWYIVYWFKFMLTELINHLRYAYDVIQLYALIYLGVLWLVDYVKCVHELLYIQASFNFLILHISVVWSHYWIDKEMYSKWIWDPYWLLLHLLIAVICISWTHSFNHCLKLHWINDSYMYYIGTWGMMLGMWLFDNSHNNVIFNFRCLVQLFFKTLLM